MDSHVFAKAQADIREGLGGRCHRGASGGITTVGGQGDHPPQEGWRRVALLARELAVARHPSRAATGTRMKVCNAFQTRSKDGDLVGEELHRKEDALAPDPPAVSK